MKKEFDKKGIVKFAILGIILFVLLLNFTRAVTKTCYDCNNCTAEIGNASAGDTIQLNNNITNPVGTCINITSKNDIIFDCINYSNPIMGDGTGTDYGIYLNSANYNKIMNCNISNFTYGIFFSRSNNNNLTNLNFYSNSGSGLYTYHTHNSTLNGITIKNERRYGINLELSNNTILTNITSSFMVDDGIFLQDCENSILTNITMVGGGSIGIYLLSSSNNTLKKIISSNNSGTGIYIEEGRNNNLTEVSLFNNTGEGLYLYLSNRTNLKDITAINNKGADGGIYSAPSFERNTFINIISENNSGYGLFLDANNNSILSNITLINNSEDGLHIKDSSNISVITVNINYHETDDGIELASSNNISFTSINSYNNSWGIYAYNSNYLSFNNINIQNNIWGLVLDYCSNNLLINITSKNNSEYGIYLEDSSYNTIRDSFIELNNLYGLYLKYSSIYPQNNLFYNNYFNNTAQFYNSTNVTNFFNTTKTAGTNIIGGDYLAGNYWAAPNGSGFSQTCTSVTDGICNTAYSLDGINYDYLPLAGCVESWSCSWSNCINDLETYTCIDSNLCQTYLLKSSDDGTTRDCGSVGKPSVKSSGGGGSSTSVTIPEATPSESVSVIINNSEMDLTSIVLNVNEKVTNGSVSIQSKEGNENLEIGLPIGRIYQSFEVTSIGFDNTNIINSTFNFKINKTWLVENNITIHFKDDTYWLVEDGIVGNIKLYRIPTGETKAIALTTFFSNEDETYYYFNANSPGFSTFIVFFNKYDCLPNSARCSENKVQLCLGNSTWLVTETCLDTCNNGRCTQGFFKSNEFFILFIVIISGIILIVLILLFNKIKKVYKPYSSSKK